MICDICQVQVPRVTLELHKRLVHKVVRSEIYKCHVDQCKREFYLKKSFQEHLRRCHKFVVFGVTNNSFIAIQRHDKEFRETCIKENSVDVPSFESDFNPVGKLRNVTNIENLYDLNGHHNVEEHFEAGTDKDTTFLSNIKPVLNGSNLNF